VCMRDQFIGRAARESGLSVDTIRFYEKVGLIQHPARTSGKFRIFRVEDIQHLRVIHKLIDLGFSLSEMKQVLELRRRNMNACTAVRDLLRRKLVKVKGKIRVLRRLEQQLRQPAADKGRALRSL
jgi:DNA-binding transcriptional MerR regulator